METTISSVRSTDSCSIRPKLQKYCTFDKDQPLTPELTEDRSGWGFNHPGLSALLVPVDFLNEFEANPIL